jgi:hypothetical protein
MGFSLTMSAQRVSGQVSVPLVPLKVHETVLELNNGVFPNFNDGDGTGSFVSYYQQNGYGFQCYQYGAQWILDLAHFMTHPQMQNVAFFRLRFEANALNAFSVNFGNSALSSQGSEHVGANIELMGKMRVAGLNSHRDFSLKSTPYIEHFRDILHSEEDIPHFQGAMDDNSVTFQLPPGFGNSLALTTDVHPSRSQVIPGPVGSVLDLDCKTGLSPNDPNMLGLRFVLETYYY